MRPPPANNVPWGLLLPPRGFSPCWLFPGEGVFDVWNRSVYGGPMPSTVNLSIRAEGEVWRDGIVAWDPSLHPRLPMMSASFRMTTTFAWPEP